MLIYYSIEGFSISVSGWTNNTVNANITNQIITTLAMINIIVGFIAVVTVALTLIELMPVIAAA
jgi:hypothetical protein